MEEELNHEGMDDEISETKKAKAKGIPVKKIVIFAVMFVAAYFLVFHGPGRRFLGKESVPMTREEQQKQYTGVDIEYSQEFVLEDITHTMYDERGKIKNLLVDVTFVAEQETLDELQRRLGQVKDIIHREINKYEFEKMLIQTTKDTLNVRIMNSVNSYLPDKDKLIKILYIEIVTM